MPIVADSPLIVPPKIISSTVTVRSPLTPKSYSYAQIKDAEAAGARVSLAQYNTIVDQDVRSQSCRAALTVDRFMCSKCRTAQV